MGITEIRVAAGSYEESIDLAAPVHLQGGWKVDFSGPASERSVVKGRPAASSNKKAPAYALKIRGTNANSKTKIERFEFRGGDASYSAGIFVVDGASPEFMDCAAYGGQASYGYGAVVLSAASPGFSSCRLDGGGGATSYGLSADGATARVAASLLLAGVGSVGGYGLSATDSTIQAQGSVLAAMAANVGYGAAFYNSKGSSLSRCTIIGGTGNDAEGVFISSSDPAIEGCVVQSKGSAKSYGILANYGDSSPSRLLNTVFLGCAGGFYFDAGSKTAYSTLDAKGRLTAKDGSALPAKVSCEGNAAGSFQLGPAPLYQLPQGAPEGSGATGPTFR